MKLEELDFFEFFKDEYGILYDGFGIGGAGIITPNQMINVVNIDGSPKKGIPPVWGGGDHQSTWNEIIKQIYKIDADNNIPLEKIKINEAMTKIELRLIRIRYVNAKKGGRTVVIHIPAKINSFQYDSLCRLNTMIKVVNALSKNKIEVLVNNNGYLPNFIDGKKVEVENPNYDEKLNNLPVALEYYKKHITIIPSSVFPKEYEIELNQGKRR